MTLFGQFSYTYKPIMINFQLNRVYWYFISLLLSLNACSTNHQPETQEISKVLSNLMEADNQGDIHGVLKQYSSDAILMQPNGPSIVGKEAIRNHYTALFKAYRFNNLKADIEEIMVAENFALIAGTTSGEMVALGQSTSQKVNGKFMMQLEKDHQGDWKIKRLIWNDAK